MKKVAPIVMVLAALFIVVLETCDRPAGKQLWIEVHDVSPITWDSGMDEVAKIILMHVNVSERKVLFIIPHHANLAMISEDDRFSAGIAGLIAKGFEIAVHGYRHNASFDFEFNGTPEEALLYNELALKEFEGAGLGRPGCFAPPRYSTNAATRAYLESAYNYVYYQYNISISGRSVPAAAHEYTWKMKNLTMALASAETDYLNEKSGIFRLSLHLPMGEDELAFLNSFLGKMEKLKVL
jgi:predicted deacetylase